MPGRRERERELARRRYERRQQREMAKRARRRQLLTRAGVITAIVAVLGGSAFGISTAVTGGGGKHKLAASPTPSVPSPACGATKPAAPQTEHFAKAPPLTINRSASYRMTLATSCGPIVIALDTKRAPQTVNMLKFLADRHFFDGTFCHRMTTVPTLTVLQCGDPTGTGTGGPGFTIPEENVKGAKYLRGTFAMANTGQPHSTSSQFFLVDKNATLPASYTVAGQIVSGLDVLDRLIAIGEDDANGQGDGHPKQRIYLNVVTVAKS